MLNRSKERIIKIVIVLAICHDSAAVPLYGGARSSETIHHEEEKT